MISLFTLFVQSGVVLIALDFVTVCIVATLLLTARNDEKR